MTKKNAVGPGGEAPTAGKSNGSIAAPQSKDMLPRCRSQQHVKCPSMERPCRRDQRQLEFDWAKPTATPEPPRPGMAAWDAYFPPLDAVTGQLYRELLRAVGDARVVQISIDELARGAGLSYAVAARARAALIALGRIRIVARRRRHPDTILIVGRLDVAIGEADAAMRFASRAAELIRRVGCHACGQIRRAGA